MTDVLVTREPLVYEEASPHSFFRDLGLSATRTDAAAQGRLSHHSAQMVVEKRITPGVSPGAGGEMVPPGWLIDKFKTAARAGSPLADLVNVLPLPPGMQSINIPKMLNGGQILGGNTAIQPGNNAPAASIDDTTVDLSSPVVTIAGESLMSQQLIDMTPAPGADAVAYLELARDFRTKVETQVLNGTGTNGQLLGIANFAIPAANTISGAAVPVTLASPAALWSLFGQAFAAIGNGRGLFPEAWLMAPRRWAYIGAQIDASGRPLMTPGLSAPTANGLPTVGKGPQGNPNVASPAYGPLQGVPVYVDGSIPAGPLADNIYAVRPSDMWLWESQDTSVSV
jgi:HK97 family phage major capsid protein